MSLLFVSFYARVKGKQEKCWGDDGSDVESDGGSEGSRKAGPKRDSHKGESMSR